MIILDENISERQVRLLRRRRIAVRQIGLEVGHKGMQDDQIVTLLHQLDRPTFFTLDADFYDHDLCHQLYCLVHLDCDEELAAVFIRPLLRFHAFNSKAKRMGKVIRLESNGLVFWRIRGERASHFSWK